MAVETFCAGVGERLAALAAERGVDFWKCARLWARYDVAIAPYIRYDNRMGT